MTAYKIFASFLLLLLSSGVFGQSVVPIRGDSLKVGTKTHPMEMTLLNKTKDSLGFLMNMGEGVTSFEKPVRLNDSTIRIGPVTIIARTGSSSKDTIYIGPGLGGGGTDTTDIGHFLNSIWTIYAAVTNDSIIDKGLDPNQFVTSADSINHIAVTSQQIPYGSATGLLTSDANLLWDYVNHAVSVFTSPSFATAHAGIILDNSVAATSGNVSYSPAVYFNGYGFSTTSKKAQIRMYNKVNNGGMSGIVNNQLVFEWQVNGGGWTQFANITDGQVTGRPTFSIGDVVASGLVEATTRLTVNSGNDVDVSNGIILLNVPIKYGTYALSTDLVLTGSAEPPVIIHTSGSPHTITLPDLSSVATVSYSIANYGSGLLTINVSGSDHIKYGLNVVTAIVLEQGQTLRFYPVNNVWYTVGFNDYESGTYTPTVTNATNITGSFTNVSGHYTRIGAEVDVTVIFSYAGITTANTSTQAYVTLPIASNFTSFTDLIGPGVVAGGTNSWTVISEAETTLDEAWLIWYPTATGGNAVLAKFTYTLK